MSEAPPAATESMSSAFLMKQADFAYELFRAAEDEVRSTERYVLVALGGIYSYLLTHRVEVAASFGPITWFVPAILVTFAGLRAVVLGLRQAALLRYLKTVEDRVMTAKPGIGWAGTFGSGAPVLSIWTSAFYIALVLVTTVGGVAGCLSN